MHLLQLGFRDRATFAIYREPMIALRLFHWGLELVSIRSVYVSGEITEVI